MSEATQLSEETTPAGLALGDFEKARATLNAQMAFVHAQVMPDSRVSTSPDAIEQAHKDLTAAYEALRTLEEAGEVSVDDEVHASFQMLQGSYTLYQDKPTEDRGSEGPVIV